jgi:transposase
MVERGDRDVDIAKALFTSTPTVQRTRARFCAEGLVGALYPKPRSGRPPVFGGEAHAHLTMLACSDPPPGRARWTLQLLANKLVELHIVESISDVQVGKMLKKTSCVPGK